MTSLVSTFYFDPCSNVSIFLTLALHTVHVDSVFVQVNGTALHVAAACGNLCMFTIGMMDCCKWVLNLGTKIMMMIVAISVKFCHI